MLLALIALKTEILNLLVIQESNGILCDYTEVSFSSVGFLSIF